MVKAKKGKKTADDTKDEDVTPSESISEADMGEESESEVEHVKEMVKKPKGKSREPKKSKLSIGDETDSDTEPKTKSKAKESKKGKKARKGSDSDDDMPAPTRSAFALLSVDDDDDDSDGQPQPVEEDEDDEPVKAKPKSQEKGGKKAKKGKKRNDDDEDIDKVLAELELEYSGHKPNVVVEEKELDEKAAKKAKQKEKKKAKEAGLETNSTAEEPAAEANGEPATKTAAQKKRDKKKEKLREKKEDTPVDDQPETTEGAAEELDEDGKSKKKKKGKEDKTKDLGKGPGKKAIAAMQETLKKIKEEEERLKREEEERIRLEEEEEQARIHQLKSEAERKEQKKLKEKQRKERLKAEGKLLTAKQRQDKARAQELINALKAQGLELPEPGEKKPRPGTRVKPNKAKPPAPQADTTTTESSVEPSLEKKVEVEIVDGSVNVKEAEPAASEDIKDSWDAESSGDETKPAKPKPVTADEPKVPELIVEKPPEPKPTHEKSEETSEEEEDDDEDDDEDSSEEDDEEDECPKTEAEKKRERALARIQKRREDAEKKQSLDNLRAAVVCVLGHVDTGKTKILDKLRRTNVQVGEAGGITQQIGATNVPIDNIRDNCKLVKGFSDMELRLPGLLIIDTPGHESFSNLRSRGSSLCDIAILVVDIMHGLEPQTIESINLLKSRKTPFLVALNKIDRLYNWETMGRKDIRDIIKAQADNTQLEFQQRTNEVVVQFAEQGLNAALFYDSPDLRSYVSLIPTSAITGEGMGNLLALIVEFCQSMLARRLMYSELLQATVLEVKAIPGLGTTIDCILINGKLAEGDTIILAGTDGPLITQIRSLLMPQPMKELRVKNAYIEYKEIKAAQGVKIAGKDLEKAIAGLNLMVAEKPDEVEICCEEAARELKKALSQIKLKDRGVYVQASTLGSLEALLEFLRTSKIPVSGIRIGPVVRKDVMKASIMIEHEPLYATILAFDVKIERDAQDLADSVGVKIFQADIIYHLFDRFIAYRDELKQKKRDEFKNIAVFPCRLRILPNCIFNSRDPIVIGVMVEAGVVKEGTPICVPSKEFTYVGIITSVEQNHKPVEMARKGMEVCIKIENVPGETPKLYGRHFDHTDFLTSKISRQSIDACKDYFRDDLTKADWQLMVELKKLFQIL